jgi:ribose 5-phosphate isomerase B
MSLAANKHKGIRAALCHDHYTAKMARLHNDANILCFGARIVGLGVVESILDAWLETEFEGGRHQRRVEKIDI